jgi:hypothetical protein
MIDEPKTITLKIQYDTDCENPLTSCDGMWTLHEGRDFEGYFDDRGKHLVPEWSTFWKLKNGLAFLVGGWLHCGSSMTQVYPLRWQSYDHRHDRSPVALLVWEHPESDMGAKTYEERFKDAKACLDEYERWANGECFGWIINDDQPDEDSCWGFVGEEYVRESVVHDYLPDERPLRVILDDETTEYIMGSALDKLPGVETLTRKQCAMLERQYMDMADEEESDLADSEALDQVA